METLESYVGGRWHRASSEFVPIHDPTTEEPIAQASSHGIDFAAALDYARSVGGASLRSMTFTERGELLMRMSKAIADAREELIALSLRNTGVTRKDAKFDLDGASGVLSYYGYLAKELGNRRFLIDGEGSQLGRSARFWGQHAWVPLHGVAVLINAFNFPTWGFAEKTACAFLAGMPVLVKPATSGALVSERCARILIDSGVIPEGAFSFVAGSLGDALDRLGPQDVLAFTGSAATGASLRRRERLLEKNTRVNIEADSLNAAVLAPDALEGSETWNLFLRDVAREITQKSGQKCTAVRRIFVTRERLALVRDELATRLADTVTGNPQNDSVTMGPLATAGQLEEFVAGVEKLVRSGAEIAYGTGQRVDGVGASPGRGYFAGPTLLVADDPDAATDVHRHEVFGPCATLMPYDGDPLRAAELVARGGGSLVCSVYSDEEPWLAEFIPHAGAWNGRLYLGSEKMAEQAMGSGLALPQSKHGGPGRAGCGEELGGLRGLSLYMQRVALQGSRAMIDRLIG
jgi:oxepin-CoA hydrolase/3-oxo-5,6-dehydrosuberyl-CoA semialdehyde dehydrogenase